MAKESTAAILEVNTDDVVSSEKDIIEDLQTHLEKSSSVDYHENVIPCESFKLYAEEENLDGLVLDLKVVVDSPQRHVESFETFISYRISVKTSRPEFAETEYVVRRRYNDFLWLRNKLIESYPTRLIPPLPNKHSLLGHLDRYAKDFIMFRMMMLNRFLNRLVKHPILSYSEHLKVFLTASLTELSSYQKSTGSGLLTKVSGGIYNITLMCNTKEKSLEFEEVKKYLTALTEKLLSFEKVICRIYKDRRELTKGTIQLGLDFEKWASTEITLSPLLLSVGQALSDVSTVHDTLLVNSLEYVALLPVKEYLLYADSVKEALLRRDTVQVQYESSIEEIHRKKNDQMSNNDGDRRFSIWRNNDKEEKLDSSETSSKLITTVENNHDKLQIANEDLRSDLERWNIEKKHDIKCILLALSEHYIQYYQKSLTIWEDSLKKINVPSNKKL